MIVTGKRHCFHYDYEVGYDDDGRILGAEVDDGLARRLLGRPVRPGGRRAPSATSTMPTTCPTSTSAPLLRQDEHAVATPRSAASAARRARSRSSTSSTTSRATSAAIRSTCAGSISTATTRAQRHAVRPDGRRQRDPRARRRARSARSDYRARRAAIDAFNATQPGAEARPRAHAGEVRHLVQRHAPEPGRRAGARLRGRLGAASTTAAPRWARA